MKKSISLLLAFLMMLSLLPMSAFAEGDVPSISVKSTCASPNSTVDVALLIENNPGITASSIMITFDEGLTLVGATAGDAFSALTMTPPKQLSTVGSITGSCRFAWFSSDIAEEDIKDGTILTLTFEVSEDVSLNEDYMISVSCEDGDTVGKDGNAMPINTGHGYVSIIDYTPGDVDQDGRINMRDVVMLSQYIVDGCQYDEMGYAVSLKDEAADVNADGKINMQDVVLISRYIVDGCITDPNGYNVELLPAYKPCKHQMEATEAVAATCTEDGNIAFWHCTKCDKYFSDAAGNSRILPEDTIIAAHGHTVVVDEAVPAKIGVPGLTRGEHCGVCGEVLIAQEETEPLKSHEHNIIFDVANGDSYLSGLIKKGELDSNNQATYTEENGLTLKNPTAEGYRFLGWYDGTSASNSNKVTKIEKGSTEDVYLYGIWEKIPYSVQLQSDIFVEKQELTYTVDKGVSLPTPSLSNYVFTGWSDEDGTLIKNNRIPVGSTGDYVLTANWTSERYKAYTKTKLNDPIIVEDEDSNIILFTYEIGEMQNVPLYTIKDFGYIAGDGISKTETATYSMKISESEMNAYAKAIASATTESSNWTLSNDWNEITSVNEGWCEEKGLTKEEAETIGKSSSNTWNVSSGSSGSTSTTTLDTNQDGWENQAKINGSKTNSSSHSSEDSTTKTSKNSISINGSYGKTPPKDTGGKEWSVSGGYEGEWGKSSTETSSSSREKSKTRGFELSGTDSHSGLHTDSTVTDSSWNSSSSYGGSNTTSSSSTTATALSERIAKSYEENSSYAVGGATSNSSGLTQQQSSSDEYSSSVSYSTETQESVTRTWTTQATKPGYHRWVIAGTAHVFATVGYDMETKAFFVYTYSLIDDKTYEFEDYSYSTASFNDHQNSVISFEIPYEVAEYVADRTAYSEGLEVDMETGIITGYNGEDNCVVIPEYMNIGDGEVVKVTGISSTAFKGNADVEGIILSDFITEIPDSAFEDCSALVYVDGGEITKIGSKAFSGCTSIEYFGVTDAITSLGDHAFDGVNTIKVNPANTDVLDAALTSDVGNIVLYIDNIEGGAESLSGKIITIPESVEAFGMNGYGKTFENLTIVSDAKETYICKANFVGNERIPLQVSSSKIVLNQVSVKSAGISMALTAENTEIGLQGTIRMDSDNENTVICKNISLYKSNPNADGKLSTEDDICVCGEITGRQILDVKDTQIKYISNAKYESLLSSYKIYFYPEEGTCEEQSRMVANSVEIGEMPVAVRENYIFDGWYLKDGTKVTETTVFSSGNDIKLYAHWKVGEYSVNWNTEKNCTITVTRTASPYANAEIGALASGDTVYYGDELSVEYKAATGYTLGNTGKESVTVADNVTAEDIFASVKVNAYTATWVVSTGTTITVSRTSSPNANAETGTLKSGAPIYYGDVLSVKYAAKTGYTLAENGKTSITVTGNVTKDDIYANADAKEYTYKIVYKSKNGTDLGKTTVTKDFGTTNTITAPAKTGYVTPDPQSVKWDSTTAKTITFTYGIASQPTSRQAASGWWWHENSYGISYNAYVEYQNRTASSVQIRIKWVQTIQNCFYGYNQWFYASCGGQNTGSVKITPASTWASVNHNESRTVDSNWMTVPVSATATSVSVACDWWTDGTSHNGSWGFNMPIPTY